MTLTKGNEAITCAFESTLLSLLTGDSPPLLFPRPVLESQSVMHLRVGKGHQPMDVAIIRATGATTVRFVECSSFLFFEWRLSFTAVSSVLFGESLAVVIARSAGHWIRPGFRLVRFTISCKAGHLVSQTPQGAGPCPA